jgi:hypothetical protein
VLAPDNPLLAAATAFGAIVALPVVGVMLRVGFIVGSKSSAFDVMATDVATIKDTLATSQQERIDTVWSFAVLEEDVNTIQTHLKLPIREYPDRRVGPADRRHHP